MLALLITTTPYLPFPLSVNLNILCFFSGSGMNYGQIRRCTCYDKARRSRVLAILCCARDERNQRWLQLGAWACRMGTCCHCSVAIRRSLHSPFGHFLRCRLPCSVLLSSLLFLSLYVTELDVPRTNSEIVFQTSMDCQSQKLKCSPVDSTNNSGPSSR